jgi:RNA polymerase sigma-70 factor (sigma-E family)
MERPSPPPAGRDAQIVALYEQHQAELVRLAALLTGDQQVAEELTQEAFVHAWRSWGRLHTPGAEVAYLRGVVVNLARKSVRRRLVELRHRLAQPRLATSPDPASRVDLADAVARLPIRKRACVVLRYDLGLSEQETAGVLGVSVGTVKSQTHKALEQLGRLLGDRPEPVSPRPRGRNR